MARTAEELAELKRQATQLRLAGVGVKRMAGQLGASPSVLYELLRDVPPPAELGRLRAKDDHREAAMALRAEGRSYKEIQSELGVSKGSLSLWLRHLPFPTDEQREGLRARQAEDEEPVDARGVARALRTDGWLLREIAQELGVSVKTAWLWCEGLPTPPRAAHGRDREAMRDAARAYWEQRRPVLEAERLATIALAEEAVPRVDAPLLGLLAAVAYWCEGSKSKPWRRSEKLILINSDPDVIRLWCAWLAARGVGPERLGFRVNIHESADVDRATAYWSEVVGRPPADFFSPTLKRHNPKTVRQNVGEGYHGCLVVSVRKSRDLYREVEGTWRGLIKAVLLDHGVRQTGVVANDV